MNLSDCGNVVDGEKRGVSCVAPKKGVAFGTCKTTDSTVDDEIIR